MKIIKFYNILFVEVLIVSFPWSILSFGQSTVKSTTFVYLSRFVVIYLDICLIKSLKYLELDDLI